MIVGDVISFALIVYLIYAVVISTVPFAFQPKVKEENKDKISSRMLQSEKSDGTDRILLVEDTTNAFAVRAGMIEEAVETLDIVYHTVHRGISSRAFFGDIWNAAERGVKVRIVLDGKVGTVGGSETKALEALSAHPNIQYRVYNPPHAAKPWNWHKLLHDKFIIADSKYMVLGGRNIGDQYFAPSEYTGAIVQDRDVFIWNTGNGGSVIEEVDEYMERLWNHEGTQEWKSKLRKKRGKDLEQFAQPFIDASNELRKSDPAFYENNIEYYLNQTIPTKKIRLLFNPLDPDCTEPWLGHQIRNLFISAESSVLIQTPYATANPALLETLAETSEKSGVTMVTNSLATSPNFPAFSNYISQRKKFLATGTEIYEFQSEHSIHGKSMVIDDHLSVVGSFNMDDRSFYIDTETMLLIESEEFAEVLTGAITGYKNQALLVGQNNEYVPEQGVQAMPVSPIKKGVMYFVSLFTRPLRFLI